MQFSSFNLLIGVAILAVLIALVILLIVFRKKPKNKTVSNSIEENEANAGNKKTIE